MDSTMTEEIENVPRAGVGKKLRELADRLRPNKVAFRRARRVMLLERRAKDVLEDVFRRDRAGGPRAQQRDRLAQMLKEEKRPHLAKLLEYPDLDFLRVVLCPSRTNHGAALPTQSFTAKECGIQGWVTVTDGVPVPDARVQIKNLDTNERVSARTDRNGYYCERNLKSGTYRARVSHPCLTPDPRRSKDERAKLSAEEVINIDCVALPNWNQPTGFLYSLGVWTIQYAPDTVRRPLDSARVLELVKALRRNGKGDLARRLIEIKLLPLGVDDPDVFEVLFKRIRAEFAMCTAIATDLPPGPRLDEAWRILNATRLSDLQIASFDPDVDEFIEAAVKEAKADDDISRLQRAAAIFASKWDHERKIKDLESVTKLYQAAYDVAKKIRKKSPHPGGSQPDRQSQDPVRPSL